MTDQTSPPDAKVLCFPSTVVDPVALCEMAKHWNLDQCLVIGWDKNGQFCVGASHHKHADIAWILRHAEIWLNDSIRSA